MLDSHRELFISGAEWDAFMDDVHQTLAKFGVPERERGELDAIVEHEGRHRDLGGARRAPVIAPGQLMANARARAVSRRRSSSR
jgi:hypothetical protein